VVVVVVVVLVVVLVVVVVVVVVVAVVEVVVAVAAVVATPVPLRWSFQKCYPGILPRKLTMSIYIYIDVYDIYTHTDGL